MLISICINLECFFSYQETIKQFIVILHKNGKMNNIYTKTLIQDLVLIVDCLCFREKASCEKGAEDALHILHESGQMNDLTRSSSSSSSDNCNYCVNNCSCLETGYVSQIGEKISTCANGKREEVIWAFGINISTAGKPSPRTIPSRRELLTNFFRNVIGQKHLFVKSTVSLVLNFFLAISILCTIFLYGNRDSPRVLSTLNETQVCIACNGLGLHRSALSAYKQLYNIDRVKTYEGSLLCCYENQRHVYWLLHMVSNKLLFLVFCFIQI